MVNNIGLVSTYNEFTGSSDLCIRCVWFMHKHIVVDCTRIEDSGYFMVYLVVGHTSQMSCWYGWKVKPPKQPAPQPHTDPLTPCWCAKSQYVSCQTPPLSAKCGDTARLWASPHISMSTKCGIVWARPPCQLCVGYCGLVPICQLNVGYCELDPPSQLDVHDARCGDTASLTP